MNARPLIVYLVAGEASGDALGAGLMRSIRARVPEARFMGVGGEMMAAEGLKSLFPYHELSLMGFAEVVPHMMHLFARMHQVMEDVLAKQPDVMITIDSPGFNFRLAMKLKREGLKRTKMVHYVAPSVWAYKPKRAEKCAKLFDHMLCLFPFEPEYFARAGLAATFVGHPVAERARGDGAAFRAKHGLAPEQPLVCVMPGSRVGEVRRHMPAFAPAVMELAAPFPGLALVVPTAERLLPLMTEYFSVSPLRTIIISNEEEKRNAFAAANAGLIKSGTGALEAAQAGMPHVLAYRANPMTVWLVKRMVSIEHVHLVNITLGRGAIPEFIQEECTPAILAEGVAALMRFPEMRARQKVAADAAIALMRAPGGRHPSDAAAEAVLGIL